MVVFWQVYNSSYLLVEVSPLSLFQLYIDIFGVLLKYRGGTHHLDENEESKQTTSSIIIVVLLLLLLISLLLCLNDNYYYILLTTTCDNMGSSLLSALLFSTVTICNECLSFPSPSSAHAGPSPPHSCTDQPPVTLALCPTSMSRRKTRMRI